jgi:hypothetical protein
MSEKIDIDISEEFKKKREFLRTFKIQTPEGLILVIPKVKDWKYPVYEIRVHKKGVMGPLEPTLENIKAIGGTTEQAEEALEAKEFLQKQFVVKLPKELPKIVKEEKIKELTALAKEK